MTVAVHQDQPIGVRVEERTPLQVQVTNQAPVQVQVVDTKPVEVDVREKSPSRRKSAFELTLVNTPAQLGPRSGLWRFVVALNEVV
jgi:hypothetical protein